MAAGTSAVTRLCLAAAVMACGGAEPQQDAAAPVVASSVAADWPEVAAVCDSVAAKWRDSKVAEVRQVDSTVEVYVTEKPVRGCTVVAHAGKGVDSAQATRLFWQDMDTPGWTERGEYVADGPDGGSRLLERGFVRCHVDTRTEGHDDSDSTFVPAPFLDERTHCWRASAVPLRKLQ